MRGWRVSLYYVGTCMMPLLVDRVKKNWPHTPNRAWVYIHVERKAKATTGWQLYRSPYGEITRWAPKHGI